MAELIAQGPKAPQTWRRPLNVGESFVLGRDTPPWSVPWDTFVSRQHVSLVWQNGALSVSKLPKARNPVYRNGEDLAQFQIRPGENFIIGETTFTLAERSEHIEPDMGQVLRERTFSAQDLVGLQVRNAAHQIRVLSQLPEIIARAANEQELFQRLVNLILAGITEADVVSLVRVQQRQLSHAPSSSNIRSGPPTTSQPTIRPLHWARRIPSAVPFVPSSRLVSEAVRRQVTELHVWSGQANQSFTQGDFDWAFCTPVRGSPGRGWGIYVAGRLPGDMASIVGDGQENDALIDGVKFTELVAEIWGSLEQVNELKHRQASFGQFFSPAVLDMLAEGDPEEVLRPRKTGVTVLFCDLRGFSRESEARELLDFLQGVSQVLGLMTQSILAQGGVIGDFHGDAAMGFWGWPIAQEDAAIRACQAALGIRASLERKASPFRAGIGIATGPAVAGKIGTTDQVKVTVFGPVVNLASRLEGMTKIMGVPILLDEATAAAIKQKGDADVMRVRRLAKVRPYGLESALTVSELLPPAEEHPLLTDAHIATYEQALDEVIAGRWRPALEHLHQLPPDDQGKDFLTAFILGNRRTPPAGWDGVIPMTSKS